MLGIDTNVLVRLLVKDDLGQARRAQARISESLTRDAPVWTSLLVMVEAEWVLRSRYGVDKAKIVALFTGLLEVSELSIEDTPAVEEALHEWRDSNASFTDCLIMAHNRSAGCRSTLTFDKHAARLPGGQSIR